MLHFFRHTSKPFAIALAALLICLMYNNTQNVHRHVLSDFSVVIHAHPIGSTFGNQPPQQHQHTSSEILLISLLNDIFAAFIFTFFSYVVFLRLIHNRQSVIYKSRTWQHYCLRLQMRAPPVAVQI